MQYFSKRIFDLESWEFQKDFAKKDGQYFEGPDRRDTISLLVHYHTLFGSK
jgi:hypothetical protein